MICAGRQGAAIIDEPCCDHTILLAALFQCPRLRLCSASVVVGIAIAAASRTLGNGTKFTADGRRAFRRAGGSPWAAPVGKTAGDAWSYALNVIARRVAWRRFRKRTND
jgi:hypothetical protein